MNWPKYFSLWIPIFPIVMVINQAFYGFTFKGYAIAAAFPKVCIFTAIIALYIYLRNNKPPQHREPINVTPHKGLESPSQAELTDSQALEPIITVKATFTDAEKELLHKNLAFYEELELGTRAPTTKAQEHFVNVINGKDKPRTQHEHLFLRYMKARNANQ